MLNITKQLRVTIESLKQLKPAIYLLGLRSPYLVKTAQPGQFLHVKVDEEVTILRRPLSIHKVSGNTVYLLFRVRGRGTRILSHCRPGMVLDVIGPLGNGFNVPRRRYQLPRILVAGGMGVAPLIFLGEKLRKSQATSHKSQNLVLLGAKNKNEILAEKEFKKLGFEVRIATDDGSRGFKGTVTDLLKNFLAVSSKVKKPAADVYACGPKEMLFEIGKVLKRYPAINCQVSFEQFMGCGLGICCSCAIETKAGYKKVCYSGPAFNLREIY
jgi:dihydroorotate dehydrogenase electron transfer subunit